MQRNVIMSPCDVTECDVTENVSDETLQIITNSKPLISFLKM